MIFISYSRADITQTKHLVEALSSEGIECSIDESNIPVGQAFVARLGEALLQSNGFLFVDTPASRRSYWVSREIMTACRYRRESRYHTILRVCSPLFESEAAGHWDGSISLGDNAHKNVAHLLMGHSTTSKAKIPSDDASGVSITGGGLGQPRNWTGRQDELRVLDEWWHGSTLGIWLRGLGGLGKSGLVQTWVTALACLGYDNPVSATVLHMQGRKVVNVGEAIDRLSAWATIADNRCKLFLLDGQQFPASR